MNLMQSLTNNTPVAPRLPTSDVMEDWVCTPGKWTQPALSELYIKSQHEQRGTTLPEAVELVASVST